MEETNWMERSENLLKRVRHYSQHAYDRLVVTGDTLPEYQYVMTIHNALPSILKDAKFFIMCGRAKNFCFVDKKLRTKAFSSKPSDFNDRAAVDVMSFFGVVASTAGDVKKKDAVRYVYSLEGLGDPVLVGKLDIDVFNTYSEARESMREDEDEDEDAETDAHEDVNASIRQILTTEPGERLFESQFGEPL